MRSGDESCDASEWRVAASDAEQLLPVLFLLPRMALPIPAAWAWDEAHPSNLAGGMAEGASGALAGDTAPRANPIRRLPIHEHSRQVGHLVRTPLRVLQCIYRPHKHLLHGVRLPWTPLDRRLSQGREQCSDDLRLAQGGRRADGRVHRAEALTIGPRFSFQSQAADCSTGFERSPSSGAGAPR